MTVGEGAAAPTKDRHRSVPSWVVVAIGAIITGAGLLWSSTLYDERGEAVLDGPAATVLVALIGVVGTVLGLLLQRSSEIRHQVKNSHTTNLRDDIDGKHDENAEKLERIFTTLGRIDARVANVESTQTTILRTVARQSERIDELEDTHPKEKP